MHVFIGGSQTVRLNRLFPIKNSISLAVSGASVSQLPTNPWLKGILRDHVKRNPQGYHSNDTLFLLAGTNDFLRGVSVGHFKKNFVALLDFARRNFGRIVVAKIPPIPRLPRRVNEEIALVNRWLEDVCRPRGPKVILINSFDPFIDSDPGRVRTTFFESRYSHGKKDLIHLNRSGLAVLHRLYSEAVGV